MASLDFVKVTNKKEIAKVYSLMKKHGEESRSGSQYIDTEKGMYRLSDHWGLLRNDFFFLHDPETGNTINGFHMGFTPFCQDCTNDRRHCRCKTANFHTHTNLKKIDKIKYL